MSRINKDHDFLQDNEDPRDFGFDLIYRACTLVRGNEDAHYVDYNLSTLTNLESESWQCCELEDLDQTFKRVLLFVYPFDSLTQISRDISAAGRKLERGGELRVVVPRKSGAKRISRDLKNSFHQVLGVKSSGKTLFICSDPAPREFSESLSKIEFFDPESEQEIVFAVRSGLFSFKQVDVGTRLLLSVVTELKGKSILDVGCGYGAIGVSMAARGGRSTLIDIDARAVKLSRMNLAGNGLAGDVLSKIQPYEFDNNSFDIILSNPPTHAGSDTLRLLFSEMVRVCKREGFVCIVIREHLNYEKWLNELGSVSKTAAKDGYKVLTIRKHIDK